MLEKLGYDKPLPEIISERIVEFILQNGLKAGDKLPSEAEFASTLVVGRSTVREAIKILISKNIVMIKRGLGTYVSEKMGVTDDPLGFVFIQDKKKLLLDTLNVRMMIEPNIAEMAACMATDKEIDEIQRLCDEVEEFILSGIDHIEKDIELHTQIAKSSRNLVISNLLPIINGSILSISGSIPTLGDVTQLDLKNETISTHREIVTAIRNRDGKRAFKAMEGHILYNKEMIESLTI